MQQEIISDGTGTWQTAKMQLEHAAVQGDERGAHIHMLYASPIEEQPEPPEPEPEPDLDTDALWTAEGCQEDVDGARGAYQAHLAGQRLLHHSGG